MTSSSMPNRHPLAALSVVLWAGALAGCPGPMGTDAGAPLIVDAGGEADAGPPPPCEGQAGTFNEQTLRMGVGLDAEDRAYFLYVPSSYDCEVASPLLIHFHGTAGFPPEERFQLDSQLAMAEREGVILVRPRSRPGGGPQPLYRWDQNPGDIERNLAFTHALLDDVEGRYHVDEDRLYMSGFSSGANMVAQLLGEQGARPADERRFKGAAPLAGGSFMDFTQVSFAPDELRLYAATGHRDYLLLNHRVLVHRLTWEGLDDDQVFRRTSDAGHGHFGWHADELWAWLDRAERPAPGTLAAGWTASAPLGTAVAPDGESLLALAEAPDGDLVVTGAEGTILKGPELNDLAEVANIALPTQILDGQPFRIGLPAVCLDDAGNGYALGEAVLVQTLDGGESWARIEGVPEYNEPLGYGVSVANDVLCWSDGADQTVLAAGYWNASRSYDGAVTWAESFAPFLGGDGQVAALARDPGTGTLVAVGWFYSGASVDDGATFTEANSLQLQQGWLSDVVALGQDVFVAVGDAGDILRSVDGGASWTVVVSPVLDDLYAVAAQGQTLVAVGRQGAAVLSQDGGLSWTDVSAGVGSFLADVRISADGTSASVIGEAGARLTLMIP